MRIIAGVAALVLAGCQRNSRYFGNPAPPPAQHLVYVNTYEPSSIDPDAVIEIPETNLSNCIFEGLTVNNPFTMQPMAGVATHYEIGAGGRELTFYLRGHSHPKGARLPDFESLPPEFSHGRHAPPDSVPSLWSDGAIVTAGDFVYALQRVFDPAAASPQSRDPVISNAEEIRAGRRPPAELGAEALDDLTLRLRLTVPASYFLATQAVITLPLPRRVVERARAEGRRGAWARHAGVVGNGPFILTRWRPYDYIEVRKSPTYYARDLVRLQEIKFLALPSGPPVINLYRTGAAHSLYTDSMPLSLVPALESKADFRRDQQYGVLLLLFNLHEPPFDNRMVRWALNMAVEKRALAKYWRTGVMRHVVPAMPGYTPPESRIVKVNGKTYDVMAYDPAGARELLAAAGYGGTERPLSFTINTSNDEQGRQTAEILRQMLQTSLDARVQVNPMQLQVLGAGTAARTLHGAALFAWTVDGADPYVMLGPVVVEHYAGYRDSTYSARLHSANQTLDAALRLRRLAECEALLMEGMPIVPMSAFPAVYLQKPFIRGLTSDKQGLIWFRYAWIDTGWKP